VNVSAKKILDKEEGNGNRRRRGWMKLEEEGSMKLEE
jgi:hypothetical protein